MTPINQSPVYNLKAALQSTGLKADVLRAWERRYDLPKPQRTPGGHRLYSEYDIATVKWLRARQAEGMNISRAVELWQEALGAGRDPLLELAPAGAPAERGLQPAAGTSLDLLRQEWLQANLAFDSDRVDEILNQAFALYPLETVCTEILQRGLSEIGNAWHLDQASVQQEHFASALGARRLDSLISAAPRPTRQSTVLIGCPPGELHTFSALLLNLFLRRSGWNVVYLGADVPFERLEETFHAVRADLIVLAAQQLTTAATLRSTALSLQPRGIPLAYGGLIFNRVPGLRERIPAAFLGENLDEAARHIERLLAVPAARLSYQLQEETLAGLARLYREKRARIEAALLSGLKKGGYNLEQIHAANAFFGSGLSAALALGDPAFLEADLEWLKRLLAERKISGEGVIPYLSAYSNAIREEMGRAGAPITDWMDATVARKEN